MAKVRQLDLFSPIRRLAPWIAGGAIVGLLIALKASDLTRAAELVSNRQWFALSGALSEHLLVWVSAGIAIGVLLGAASSWYSRSPARYRRLIAIALAVVSGTAVLAPLVALVMVLSRPHPETPNILLVVLDTARRDRLSVYGYERPTSPNLDAISRESTLFMNAYSTSSWTQPAHASLFTGLYPCAHGVTQESSDFSSRFVTLAEALWERGYRTAGFVGNPMVGGAGFKQGFEEWRRMWGLPDADDDGKHPAVQLMQEYLGRESSRPFFVFINLIEPHSPYDSSRDFFGLYDRHPELSVTANRWQKHVTGEEPLDQQELEHLGDLYDSEIQYVDSVVGELAGQLRDLGIIDSTVLIVTSDHGEHFGEHGLVDHVFSLYEPLVRVPLLIRYPREFTAASRDSSFVQLHDLFETILSLAGASGKHSSQGVGLLNENARLSDRAVVTEYYYPQQALGVIGPRHESIEHLNQYKRRLRAIRHGSMKMIVGSDGQAQLYDVLADPTESIDLSTSAGSAPVVQELGAQFEEWARDCAVRRVDDADSPINERPELGEETRRVLRSLGYIR